MSRKKIIAEINISDIPFDFVIRSLTPKQVESIKMKWHACQFDLANKSMPKFEIINKLSDELALCQSVIYKFLTTNR